MRKLSVIIITILLGLVVLLAGCKSGAVPTAAPPSSPAAQTGAPVRLVFTTQPGGAVAGSAFGTQPVVAAEDAAGNITSYQGLVVLTITAGTGASEAHLLGGTRAGLVGSMLAFRDLSIDKAAAGYTLTAASGTLSPATSAPFTIVSGAPATLAFTVQPSGGVAGSPLTTQPEVTVQDHYGNTATGYEGSVTLAFVYGKGPGGGGVVSGAATARVVNSIARFTDVSINKAEPDYTITAMSGSLEQVISQTFTVLPGAPTQLEFTVQPGDARAGTPFDTQPKVAVEDVYGNVVTSSRASMTLSLNPGTGTAGAVLSGTQTLIAEGGIGGLAELTDLSIDRAGSGYMLTATSSGLTPATSQAFDVLSP